MFKSTSAKRQSAKLRLSFIFRPARAIRLIGLIAALLLLTACRPLHFVSLEPTADDGTSQSGSYPQTVQTLYPSDTSAESSTLNTSDAGTSAATQSSDTAATQASDTAPSAAGSSEAATPPANTTAKATPTAKPTKKPAATATPTIKPTKTPTSTPIPTTPPTQAPSNSFPAKNYGTFFRDNYGQNSSVTASTEAEGGISVDTGSTPYGVLLIRVDSIAADKRCKAIISEGGSSYQYDILDRGKYVGIPLQLGNGSYQLNVYEGLGGDSYASKWSFTFSVSLASSLKPYTASSIMSDFSRGSGCVGKANSLCSGIGTSTGKVDAVYSWIVNNISYDRALASSISNKQITTYVPDPDRTYSSRKGICFDYASLMCAMLRSQGIPTRLIVGSTSLGYHAWNEVFFEGKGWVVVASFEWQQIDGSDWVLFDSTFAAGGMSGSEIQNTTHTKQKTY